MNSSEKTHVNILETNLCKLKKYKIWFKDFVLKNLHIKKNHYILDSDVHWSAKFNDSDPTQLPVKAVKGLF